MKQAPVFLTGQWKHLAMLNYEIDPAILRGRVPRGTELDHWHSKTMVSVVGFMFLETCVLGIKIPFHVRFEEVNLRFYVRRKAEDGWRRGVVFIKEIVPRRAIAAAARLFYNESYIARPMRHRVELDESTAARGVVEYGWRNAGRWNRLRAVTMGAARQLIDGSEAEFITEHYWGYATQRDGGTVEYQVEHPRWSVWDVSEHDFDCDIGAIYGAEFVESLSVPPSSAFVALGSEITVRRGLRIA
ncbi:MAG: YqjF family protein [Blastocatellia bacterium]